jgi:hypothetical protein
MLLFPGDDESIQERTEVQATAADILAQIRIDAAALLKPPCELLAGRNPSIVSGPPLRS